jgi:hypothetical protein
LWSFVAALNDDRKCNGCILSVFRYWKTIEAENIPCSVENLNIFRLSIEEMAIAAHCPMSKEKRRKIIEGNCHVVKIAGILHFKLSLNFNLHR